MYYCCSNFFIHFQVFYRKLKKAVGKKDQETFRYIKQNEPVVKLDHLVKERYIQIKSFWHKQIILLKLNFCAVLFTLNCSIVIRIIFFGENNCYTYILNVIEFKAHFFDWNNFIYVRIFFTGIQLLFMHWENWMMYYHCVSYLALCQKTKL